MHSPSSLVRVGSVPCPSSTPHSISRPKTAASTTTLGSCSRAASIAASSAVGVAHPGDAHARPGPRRLDEHRPRQAVHGIHRGGLVAAPLLVGDDDVRARPAARPTRARTFMTCLSIITADAVTPDPTYLTSARSSRPWIVPSSPNGPCSSGKTTSTSPRVRGGCPASCTTRVRSVALVGTMTLAAPVSTSGTWPGPAAAPPGRRARAPSGRPWRCRRARRRSGRGRAPRGRWRPSRTTPRARRTGRRRRGPRGSAARLSPSRVGAGLVVSSVLIARDSIRWPQARPCAAAHRTPRASVTGDRLR